MLAYLGEILLLPASEIEQEEEEACVSGGSCLYFVGDSSMRASSSPRKQEEAYDPSSESVAVNQLQHSPCLLPASTRGCGLFTIDHKLTCHGKFSVIVWNADEHWPVGVLACCAQEVSKGGCWFLSS